VDPSVRAATLALLTQLVAGRALADTPAAQAHAHFIAAHKLFGESRFDDASAEFKRAYALDPVPKYLYDAAQATRLGGNCAEAVGMYQAFVKVAPDEDARLAAADNIARCRGSGAAGEAPPIAAPPSPGAPGSAAPTSAAPTSAAPASAAPTSAAPASASPYSTPSTAAAPTNTTGASAATVTATPAPAAKRRRQMKVIAAAGISLTAASLLTAAILEGVAASKFNELHRTCAPNCTNAQLGPLPSEIDAATGLFISAAVAATATGVSLAVLRWSHR
jgi:hypothetical protein